MPTVHQVRRVFPSAAGSASHRPDMASLTGTILLLLICLPPASRVQADTLTDEQREFFETRIRPVLAEQCYACHNSSDAAEGGLALDYRDPVRTGGDSGPLLDLQNPEQSLLLQVIRHDVEGLEMPQDGPRLDDAVIADLTRWITMGAPDPRDEPPSDEDVAAHTGWAAKLERRRQWWSFLPIQSPDVPAATAKSVSHPVDRFVQARLHEQNLSPARPAAPAVLVRRLFFVLTGLPPTADEAESWTQKLTAAGDRSVVVAELTDDLLQRPQFGERWARHWMDWIRYAESHGSEGDPGIDHAWMYRDYLIRALNDDIPLDQLIREHVAGDLLPTPRLNSDLQLNESAIGTAHWRMVFHGFAPTDPLDERVRFTDDQINAFSKAFLGLTVSCARCHDHKFDAISQQDYYALYGILESCRPGSLIADTEDVQQRHQQQLRELKQQIRMALSRHWQTALNQLAHRLQTDPALAERGQDTQSLLHPLFAATQAGANVSATWQRLADAQRQRRDQHQSRRSVKTSAHWQLGDSGQANDWFVSAGRRPVASPAGDFAVALDGNRILTGIYPAGVYTHLLSTKHGLRVSSPDIPAGEKAELWIRAIGTPNASMRPVIRDYPRRGTVYPIRRTEERWKWHRFDLEYWAGDEFHVELATAWDAPVELRRNPRSWFGVREVYVGTAGQSAPGDPAEHMDVLFQRAGDQPPVSLREVSTIYEAAIRTAVDAWQQDQASDEQALLLAACLQTGLLPNDFTSSADLSKLVQQYRQLEQDIPIPTRVPGLQETVGKSHPLFLRGNHHRPGDDVPRRFLEAIDATPYDTRSSGRLQLAEDLLRDDNPLTRRVLVNRIWHHLFGQGLVRTPDNLGRLGDQPSHPLLLDWLATEFVRQKWSLKSMIRLAVTTHTWQQASEPSPQATAVDPDNRLLSHASSRRVEAEAIRDAMLSVSGSLDLSAYGAPVKGSSGRRSLYVAVIRNSLDPFLRAFDFPEPFTAVGRRDATNVPAQSLMLMNDERVVQEAQKWADRVLQNKQLTSDEQRIHHMFLTAFGRPSSSSERTRALEWLAQTRSEAARQDEQIRRLRQQLKQRQQDVAAILTPVHQRLLGNAQQDLPELMKSLPTPMAQWNFRSGLQDLTGTAHVQLKRGATRTQEGLQVRDGGYAVTSPVSVTVWQKTLTALVQLDNLQQRGGGIMTLQSQDGGRFDAIVFGEQAPQEWLAGSNNFRRTRPFGGAAESAVSDQPVHIAMVWHDDGRVSAYRNGQPYGKTYQSSGLQEFRAGQSVVSFGLRHLPAGGNRLLSGQILSARLFDHALNDQQIRNVSRVASSLVTEQDVFAALTDQQRQLVTQHRQEIDRLNQDLQDQSDDRAADAETEAWSQLARALFTFREFVYLK